MRSLGTARMAQLALATALVALLAADASAFSRGRYGSAGSYASAGSHGSYGSASYGSYGSSGSYASVSYGSSGSYASSGSYGSYGSYGSAGSSARPGLFARWHARKAARRAARASYGYSGSYGSYGSYASASYGSASYGSGSYGSGSYGSASYGSASYGSSYSIPVEYSTPVDAGCATCSTDAVDAATIQASVPVDAKVYVNDKLTTSTGTERTFASNGLAGGRSYAYDFRVVYNVDGSEKVEQKTIEVHAGDDLKIAFGGSNEPVVAKVEPARTELKLHVPSEAKVFLSGSETSQTGEDRVFTSTRLNQGQQWSDYVVRVELQRDGKTLVKEKTLTIEGGQDYDLAFEFEDSANQIAAMH